MVPIRLSQMGALHSKTLCLLSVLVVTIPGSCVLTVADTYVDAISRMYVYSSKGSWASMFMQQTLSKKEIIKSQI